MSTRRLRYNSSINGTDSDNMSMESLRARRAEIEAKRRQLQALDQQRMRDRKCLSSADYMTLKRTRTRIEQQSAIASRRNRELSRAYEDLLHKHTHVIEDHSYLSRAMARYKMHIGQNSDVWRSVVERYNQDRINYLDSKRQTVEQRRQNRRVEFMKEQQQAKKLAQKRTEYAIAEGQDRGEYMQMNEYRERLNASMKETDKGVSEAAHRTALDMRDRARAAKDAHLPSYFTEGLLHKVAYDMHKHVAMAKEDLQQSDRPATTDLSTEDDGESDDQEVLELERKVLEEKKFLEEARRNLHQSVSPPQFDRSFVEHTPELSHTKPGAVKPPTTPSRGAMSSRARDTKPLSMTEIDKKQSAVRQFLRKKPKARTPPETKTPKTETSDDALSSISSPSASSIGQSPISSELDYDEDQKDHMLNIPAGMGEIRMVRADTDESKELMSSIHSEVAAVGLQKHYRGHLARLQTAELTSSTAQRAVQNVDEASTYRGTPQYRRSPPHSHEQQQWSDSSESRRQQQWSENAESRRQQQLRQAEENLHFQRLAAQHGYGVGMTLELWDASWSRPKECRVSKIIRDRLELAFGLDDDTDTSPETKIFSFGEVDVLTANFRQFESERKTFMTTLVTRNWTAGRSVSSVLLPHKGKRSPVQKQLISVNFMGRQKDLTLDQLEASVDAAGKRTELLARIRHIMHATITEMMNNNSSSFDAQTIKKRVIERLQHPDPKVFRFGGSKSKKWVKFFNEELKRCVKSELDTHEQEFKPSTPVKSTQISNMPVQKPSVHRPAPPSGAPPPSVTKQQRDSVQEIDRQRDSVQQIDRQRDSVQEIDRQRDSVQQIDRQRDSVQEIDRLRNLEQQRQKQDQRRNDTQDKFQLNLQEQQEDMSRIQTQKLNEHEHWRKELKEKQILIQKEQEEARAKEIAERKRLEDEKDHFRQQTERRLQEISERQEQELREQELTRQRNAEELAHAMEQQEKDLENKELALQQHTSAAPEPNSEELESANSTDETHSETNDIDPTVAAATSVPPEPEEQRFANNSATEGPAIKKTKSMWGAFRNVFKKKSGSVEDKKKKEEKKLQKQDEKRKKEQTKQELKQQKKEQKELEKRRKKEAKELKKQEKAEAVQNAKRQKELEKMKKNASNHEKQSQREDSSSNHEREEEVAALPPREEPTEETGREGESEPQRENSSSDHDEAEREDESQSQRENSSSDHEEAGREDKNQPKREISPSDHEEAGRQDESQSQKKESSSDHEEAERNDESQPQRKYSSSDHEEEDTRQPRRDDSSADPEQRTTDDDNRPSRSRHPSSDHEEGGSDNETQNQRSAESVDDNASALTSAPKNTKTQLKPKASSIYGDESSEEEEGTPEQPRALNRPANMNVGPKPMVTPKTINSFGSESSSTPQLGVSDGPKPLTSAKVINSFGSKSFAATDPESSAAPSTQSALTPKATDGESADDDTTRELLPDPAENDENETDVKAFELESLGSDDSGFAVDDGAPIKRRQPIVPKTFSSDSETSPVETKKSPGDSSDDEFGGFGKSTSLSGVRRGLSLGSTLHNSVSSFRSKNTSSRLPMQLQNLRSFGAGSDDDDDDDF